ncbi:MAG TPA: hypothetical protein O0X55_05190 [Methanocorpusculum sp.]|nr:hypothetical protein [Methanocorpusculum sp.]
MKKLPILAAVLIVCAAGFLIFAGINGFWQTPEEETEYPYPISFLKIDAVETPNDSYRIIALTESDQEEYPVLLAALENGDTYLNIHPEGDMTAEEYYAIDSFEWESYVSYNGSLYHIALGPIGLAPPVP